MICVGSKEVCETLDELVQPSHTALVIIDMQRDFVAPEGAFGQMGIDLSMYSRTIPKLRNLLDSARSAGVLVCHLRNTALPNWMSDAPSQLRFNLRMHAASRRSAKPLQYTIPGTPGFEFIDEAAPQDGELIVQKYRSSGFWGTNLDLLLRSNGVKTVVVAGCTTEGCVESTARDAMFNNYYVVIAEDCVGSDDAAQHDASMLLMRHRFDLATGSDIEMSWAGSESQPGVDVRRAEGALI